MHRLPGQRYLRRTVRRLSRMQANVKNAELESSSAFVILSFFGAVCNQSPNLVHQQRTQDAEGNAQNNGGQHIGGVMDVQIQPGEGD